MDVDRHSASVVRHLQRSVGVQHHVDLLGVAGQRLVDAVVDDLVSEVIGARRVRVHPGTTANGLEPAQDFDVRSAVVVAHCPDPRSNGRIVRAPARSARDCSAFPFRIETEMLCSPRVRTYPRSWNEQATRASSEADRWISRSWLTSSPATRNPTSSWSKSPPRSKSRGTRPRSSRFVTTSSRWSKA